MRRLRNLSPSVYEHFKIGLDIFRHSRRDLWDIPVEDPAITARDTKLARYLQKLSSTAHQQHNQDEVMSRSDELSVTSKASYTSNHSVTSYSSNQSNRIPLTMSGGRTAKRTSNLGPLQWVPHAVVVNNNTRPNSFCHRQ